MSIFTSKILCLYTQRRCLTYFSNAFNKIAREPPPQFAHQSKTTYNLDFDVFVNQDHRNDDFLEKLLKLRKQKECSDAALLPNIVVRQLLDISSAQEAIAILRKPLRYGVFIDQFTGCHLIDMMLHSGNALEAAQISTILIERGLCNNELVALLALQSFYTFLKTYKPKQEETLELSAEQKKERVKFLRNCSNPSEKSEERKLGEAMIALSMDQSTKNLFDISQNISFLGFVLSNQMEGAEKHLLENKKVLHKDVLKLSLKLIESLNTQDYSALTSHLGQTVNECTEAKSFDDILDLRLKRSVASFEPKLIAEYGKVYEAWKTNYQNAIMKEAQIQNIRNRVGEIKNTLSDIQQLRENLWFFENKENLDIQIYKKKIYYPKRWFGKKKSPKSIDAFYVPPTI
ncbi:hypothetical protein KR222_010769 [Zaprionus bogoriensis]|nr:hypothetical protein KR222_010769 [Zaprionus bogoriensis]